MSDKLSLPTTTIPYGDDGASATFTFDPGNNTWYEDNKDGSWNTSNPSLSNSQMSTYKENNDPNGTNLPPLSSTSLASILGGFGGGDDSGGSGTADIPAIPSIADLTNLLTNLGLLNPSLT
jgi:hypothetical protein